MSTNFLNSNSLTETLLAAMAAKQFDINSLIKSEFEETDMSMSQSSESNGQHGIWNTLNQDGLQLLLAQREKQKQLQKGRRDRPSTDAHGFVYVDVSESNSPDTQSSASSMSQPPASNLSSVSYSSSSSHEGPGEKIPKRERELSSSMSNRAPRAYRWASPQEKESFKYKAKRERNNEAVRRSREKNKVKKLMEDEKYDHLRKRYNAMLDSMKKCSCGCAAQFLIDHGAQI